MADGTMEEIAFAGRLAACAVGRNVRTHNYKAHGALVMDLETGKKYSYFPTEGPCQAIGISPDGEWLAVRALSKKRTASGWQAWKRRR